MKAAGNEYAQIFAIVLHAALSPERARSMRENILRIRCFL